MVLAGSQIKEGALHTIIRDAHMSADYRLLSPFVDYGLDTNIQGKEMMGNNILQDKHFISEQLEGCERMILL